LEEYIKEFVCTVKQQQLKNAFFRYAGSKLFFYSFKYATCSQIKIPNMSVDRYVKNQVYIHILFPTCFRKNKYNYWSNISQIFNCTDMPLSIISEVFGWIKIVLMT